MSRRKDKNIYPEFTDDKIIKRIYLERKSLNDSIDRLAKDPKYKNIMEKADKQYSPGLEFNVAVSETDTLNPDSEIYTSAEILMDSINAGEITLGMLDLESKCKILYYLERYNKRVGRILDIQTRIPLSTIKLQKPKAEFRIVSDYVYRVFSKIFDSAQFQQCLEKVVRHYWLFSFSALMIEDDFEYLKEVINIDDLDLKREASEMRVSSLTEEDKKRLKEIDIKYTKAPSSVSAKVRKNFIREVLSIDNPKYKGPVRITVLPALLTLNRAENLDLDYYIYGVPLSKEFVTDIERTIEDSEGVIDDIVRQMQKIGYSESMTRAYIQGDPMEEGREILFVDTDPFHNKQGMYVAVIHRPGMSLKDNSLFNRVLMDCIDLSVANQRLRDKVNRGFKKDLLVTTGELEDRSNIDELDVAIQESAKSPEGSIIVTNMNVSVQDLDLNVNSNLDLQEVVENANKNISEGVGIPESLITDSTDAYSNSFLKTIILENEMISFRRTLKQFIEEKIFKPIAIKMGFIATDEWGDTQIIYPEIAFNRLSLARGADDLEFLSQLQSDGKMSLKVIFESLGIDYDETMSQILSEQTHVSNSDIRSAFSSAIANTYTENMAKSKRIKEELSENFDIPISDVKNEGE